MILGHSPTVRPEGKTVVALLPDTGDRYLFTAPPTG